MELNPANGSFHPVEAAGTNQTSAMAASLGGTSPYKLWNFTTASTVRCSSCHGDPSSIATGTGADADLPAHASTNRGILLANYRDRVLKPGSRPGLSAEPYQAADFALCYLCHAEEPYRQESSSATNFRYHFKHLNDISGGSAVSDIDTPGRRQREGHLRGVPLPASLDHVQGRHAEHPRDPTGQLRPKRPADHGLRCHLRAHLHA